MSKVKIIGDVMKNMPWQDKPVGCEDVVWRHDENPIIG
jgi:beta-1,4-mannooligosaccharide/beta-1,4-mannosyl-N-acetylglucosamine phosphorylase